MIKILFVCLGNICRSPLAEGVFAGLVTKNGLSDRFSLDSAGTAGYHIGCAPDPRSIKTALNHGITLNHVGRKLTREDFLEFDYILAMDKNNHRDILTLGKSVTGKSQVLLFRDFDPEKGSGEVPDPYHGSMSDFEEVYSIALRSSEKLLEHIRKEHKI